MSPFRENWRFYQGTDRVLAAPLVMARSIQINRRITESVSAVAAALLMMLVTGCITKGQTGMPTHMVDRAARMKRGYIYYLDGAGGGTARKNFAGGIKDGLLAAEYTGAGEMFSWETDKGLLKDQKASVAYKRSKARELATEIEKHMAEYPGNPVSILAWSAGCAQAVFALEELPETSPIERVVLLGASISGDYDLTEALKRIRDQVYIFTSTKDEMIGFMMKFTGTADRKFHDPGAGIHGFILPEDANEETRRLYAEKITTIPWTKEFKKSGDKGRHYDNVRMEFIRDRVAPILMRPAVQSSGALVGTSQPASTSDNQAVGDIATGNATSAVTGNETMSPQ